MGILVVHVPEDTKKYPYQALVVSNHEGWLFQHRSRIQQGGIKGSASFHEVISVWAGRVSNTSALLVDADGNVAAFLARYRTWIPLLFTPSFNISVLMAICGPFFASVGLATLFCTVLYPGSHPPVPYIIAVVFACLYIASTLFVPLLGMGEEVYGTEKSEAFCSGLLIEMAIRFKESDVVLQGIWDRMKRVLERHAGRTHWIAVLGLHKGTKWVVANQLMQELMDGQAYLVPGVHAWASATHSIAPNKEAHATQKFARTLESVVAAPRANRDVWEEHMVARMLEMLSDTQPTRIQTSSSGQYLDGPATAPSWQLQRYIELLKARTEFFRCLMAITAACLNIVCMMSVICHAYDDYVKDTMALRRSACGGYGTVQSTVYMVRLDGTAFAVDRTLTRKDYAWCTRCYEMPSPAMELPEARAWTGEGSSRQALGLLQRRGRVPAQQPYPLAHRLGEALAKEPATELSLPGSRRAAVAMILRPCRSSQGDGDIPGEVELLLLKRASRTGDPWSGNVCLPGGHVEPKETLVQAAIRETKEETGLDLDVAGCHLLGRLPDRKATGTTKLIVVSSFVFTLTHATRDVEIDLQQSEIA
ncbi:hypothetical protein CYMTET_35083, partial [Cymbomonas tetramitiformis]